MLSEREAETSVDVETILAGIAVERATVGDVVQAQAREQTNLVADIEAEAAAGLGDEVEARPASRNGVARLHHASPKVDE